MDWKTQKVLVAGSGKSGIGATDLLKVGAVVIIYDGNETKRRRYLKQT